MKDLAFMDKEVSPSEEAVQKALKSNYSHLGKIREGSFDDLSGMVSTWTDLISTAASDVADYEMKTRGELVSSFNTRNDGCEDIIREIMPSYINDTKAHFKKLSRAVETADCPSIASHAHALKGVGRNLSVDRLSDIAYQMERAGGENDSDKATTAYLLTP